MKKAEEYLKLLKSGKTYKQIGEKYNVSKMTVFLALKKYFPNETKEIIKSRGWLIGNRHKAIFTTIICKNCGKTKQSNYIKYTPKFCSKECRSEFLKKAFK